jgi:hypothetical protein
MLKIIGSMPKKEQDSVDSYVKFLKGKSSKEKETIQRMLENEEELKQC